MTFNPLAHFPPLLDGFTVIMIDENVFRPIFFFFHTPKLIKFHGLFNEAFREILSYI